MIYILHPIWCGVSFHRFIYHLCIFFGEVSVRSLVNFLMMPWVLNAVIWSCSHSLMLLTPLSSTSSSLLPSILSLKFLVTSHAQHTGSIPSRQPVQTLSKEQSHFSLQTFICFVFRVIHWNTAGGTSHREYAVNKYWICLPGTQAWVWYRL